MVWAVACVLATALAAPGIASDTGLLRLAQQTESAAGESGAPLDEAAPQLKSEPTIAVRPAPADQPLGAWIAETFSRAPALMLGLIAVIVAPLLAVAGLMLRAAPKTEEAAAATRVVRRSGVSSSGRQASAADEESFAWPAKAWVEVEGAPGGRHEIGLGMVRIGRDDDNEIRLAAKTVHRTHAVVHRTSDADFMVTDVSGVGGNGVVLNGNRVNEARLSHGDRIELGEVALRFISRPS